MRVERRDGVSLLLAAIAGLAVACSTAPPMSAEQERADAATLTASCATAPPQPSLPPGAGAAAAQQICTNELLANTVYRQLNADPIYYFRHVDVTVDHGIARLSGYVWSTDAIYRARYIARSVPGVTGVVTTQLELERNGRNSGVTR